MTKIDWMIVAGALVGGVVVGAFVSRLVRSTLSSESRPEALRKSAKPLAGLVFWGFAAAGLVAALGIIDPAALDQLPKDFIALLPKLMVAGIIIIGANVLSAFVETAMAPSISRLPVETRLRVNQGVKATIVAFAVLMAVRQIGVDTTVVNMALAAFFFAVAGSLTLLIGFGGRDIANEVASTRAIRRLISEGDQVELAGVRGTVVAVHPTAVEIVASDGMIELIPSSKFTGETVAIIRGEASS